MHVIDEIFFTKPQNWNLCLRGHIHKYFKRGRKPSNVLFPLQVLAATAESRTCTSNPSITRPTRTSSWARAATAGTTTWTRRVTNTSSRSRWEKDWIRISECRFIIQVSPDVGLKSNPKFPQSWLNCSHDSLYWLTVVLVKILWLFILRNLLLRTLKIAKSSHTVTVYSPSVNESSVVEAGQNQAETPWNSLVPKRSKWLAWVLPNATKN